MASKRRACAVLMLVIAASVPFTVVGRVMPFDEESMARIGNSESAAFIRFDPVGCDSCEKLDDFWNMCGQHFPGLIWTADCKEVPDVCEMAHVANAPRGNVVDPVFMTWTGKVMEPYTGTKNPEALVAFIQKVTGDKDREKKSNDAKIENMKRLWRTAPEDDDAGDDGNGDDDDDGDGDGDDYEYEDEDNDYEYGDGDGDSGGEERGKDEL